MNIIYKSLGILVALIWVMSQSFAGLANANVSSGPKLVLNGDSYFNVERYSNYIDPGVSIIDGNEADFVITVVGEVDTAMVGLNVVAYTARDGRGLTLSVSRMVEVTDTVAPAQVANLKYRATSSSISLSWQNPNDKDFAYLNIYRSEFAGQEGEKILSGIKPENYYDGGLASGRTYYYMVETVDDTGQRGESASIIAQVLVTDAVVSSLNGINAAQNTEPVIGEGAKDLISSEEAAVLGSEEKSQDSDSDNDSSWLSKNLYQGKLVGVLSLVLFAGVFIYYSRKKKSQKDVLDY